MVVGKSRPLDTRGLIGLGVCVLVVAFIVTVVFLGRLAECDPDFNTAVADPACLAGGPVVVVD